MRAKAAAAKGASHRDAAVGGEYQGVVLVESAVVGCLCGDPMSYKWFEVWVVLLDGGEDGSSVKVAEGCLDVE